MTLRGHLTPANTCTVGMPCRVFLDGREISRVSECHTEEGWARILVEGPDGKPIVHGEEFVQQIVRGQITVERIEVRA